MITSQDWNDWISYHNSLFTGFRDWAENEDRSEALVVWYQKLGQFELDVLKQASVELATRLDRPRGFSSHLAALLDTCRAIVARRQAEVAQGAPHRCGLCDDTGRLLVRMRDGSPFLTPAGHKTPTAYVACKCSRGDRYRGVRKCECTTGQHGWHGYPEFNEVTMEIVRGHASQRYSELYDRPAPQPPPSHEPAADPLSEARPIAVELF
ncbi:MAG: hypothetical protein GXP27_07270 [Planctomycetes bacterium]|nr:hypothetical protein [Planctomycetota bacterium]